MNFEQLGLDAPLLEALKKQKYDTPTPIQKQTIPAALDKKDILGLAQTGTGKTAAFALPTLQLLASKNKLNSKRYIRALVLTPTRELAMQVHESFKVYGQNLSLKTTAIFGGVGQSGQVKALKQGVDILIATPGRLLDLMDQGFIDMLDIEIFILDEADRMLDMGFIDDINFIIKSLPEKKQTLLFSATMPKEMDSITKALLVDPVQVSVKNTSLTADKIKQYVYYVDKNHKIDILVEFFKENKGEGILIFTRTKSGADKVVKDLSKRNISARAIHGDKSQYSRQVSLEKFKREKIQGLVATDVVSRGIDISQLKYVINYDLPEETETYIHRIGRTGRAGNEGVSISFCSAQEISLLKDIEKLIDKKIDVLVNEKYPMTEKPPKSRPKRNHRSRRKSNPNKTNPSKTSQTNQNQTRNETKSKKSFKNSFSKKRTQNKSFKKTKE